MIHEADVFMSLQFLPSRKQKEIRALLEIYQTVDQKLNGFRKLTGLHCPDGCGECCRKACVVSSVLEMQPLASFFWKKGELDLWLGRIDINDEQAVCVFYSPETLENKGHCQIYPFRPLLCRLFGFCSRENKSGTNELMLCRRVQPAQNQPVPEGIRTREGKHLLAPVSADYVMKAYLVSPDLANQCMNINLAFAKAAQIIGYYGELTECFTAKGGERKWQTKISPKNRQNKSRSPSRSRSSKTKDSLSAKRNQPAPVVAVHKVGEALPKM